MWNVKRYRKYYGSTKAFRVILHYAYVAMKKKSSTIPKDMIVNVNGYNPAF